MSFCATTMLFVQCTRDAEHSIGLKSKEELGQKIFFDQHLSNPIGQSCASCHNPADAFSDPNHSITSPGAVPGLFGSRNSPAITYSLYTPPLHYSSDDETFIGGFFWDGRVNTLEDQAKKPFFNPIEMNLTDEAMLAARIRNADYYQDYVRFYGDNNADAKTILNNVADALAKFERTPPFNSFSSKFDYYLKGKAQLSAEEARGFKLFTTKAKCSQCHVTDADPESGKILFTDFTYDNIGVPANKNSKFFQMPLQFNPLGSQFVDLGLGVTVNNLTENKGQFKVPTLRNVALSAPYFHNGVFSTLEQVVHFYNSRDPDKVVPEVDGNVNVDELGNLHLTNQEEKHLVAYMKTLTDGYHLNSK